MQVEGHVSSIFRVEGSRSVFGNKIPEDWKGISYTCEVLNLDYKQADLNLNLS